MARTNATLAAAQKGTMLSPNIEVSYYTSGRPSASAGSWSRIDNLTYDRINYIDPWYENPYDSQATIYLDNSDSAFDAYDLKGKWLRIGRGFGAEISYPPYFKIRDQAFISTKDRPRDTYVIYCEGAWNMLARYRNPSHLFFNQPDLDAGLNGYTAKDILNYVLELAGLDLGTSIADDTYIDSWNPEFTLTAGMSGVAMLLVILSIHRNGLLCRTDCMHLFSGNTGDSYTYELAGATYHPFKDAYKYDPYFEPMKVTVFASDGSSNEQSYADSDWDSSMGHIEWTDLYSVVDSDAKSLHIATAEVERNALRRVTGFVRTWNANCLQELYDSVTVTDTRGNTSGSGVVGGINCPYYPKRDWAMVVRLGGLYDENTPSTASTGDTLSYSLSSGVPGSVINQNSITANQIMANTITANEILAGTITASEIAAGTITANEIAAGTITANEIAANTITANEIAANTITASEIAANAITTSELAAGAVIAENLSSTIILSSLIVVGSGTKDSNLNGWAIGYYGATTEIVGQASGVDQVVLNTSGEIKCGGSDLPITLNVDGIDINNATGVATNYLTFSYNGSEKFGIHGIDSGVIMSSGGNVNIYAYGASGVQIYGDILPMTTGDYDLGSSSKKYSLGYINTLVTASIQQSSAAELDITGAANIDINASTGITIDAGNGFAIYGGGADSSVSTGNNNNLTISGSNNLTLNATNGDIILTGIPAADPAVAGALYYNAGTGVVYRSAG